jgi:DNA-binding MarR family transcriptional regulator
VGPERVRLIALVCYVRRDRDKQDKRRTSLRLTPRGVAVKDQQKVLEPALVGKMLERLKPHDRKAALQGLELLASAASALVASPEFKKLLLGDNQ